ncbi:MAG: adenylate/guanylate cyclase domain-containing protein [Solirubrobacterales bacterium]|nr:MAG: adenylate/guanylate cyclase domain-containing protein [Solirubrobacterales bacterium]
MVEQPETRYAANGDVQIAYQVVGEGPLDLVFVPGGLHSLDPTWLLPAFKRFVGRLSAFARVILYDKRGQGSSDRGPEVATLEDGHEVGHIVLDAAAAGKVGLFGLSEGGAMSALFAASYPERTRGAAFFGSFVRMPQDHFDLETLFDQWGTGESLRAIAPSVATAESVKAFAAFERSIGSPAAIRSRVETALLSDVRPILSTLQVPTLVLHRDEKFVPIECGREIAELVPGSRFVELPGEDHIPWVGDLDSVVDELEEFFTGERHAAEPDRALKTVLFTDIVDSTARASELGDLRWRSVLDAHDELTRSRVAAYEGRPVKSTGDGFLATFDGPARAVRCAGSITRRIGELGIELRAGLHTGECELRGEDVGGIAVHIGARVGALGSPGEVLVTRTVKDLVVGSGIEFSDRGAHVLKGVPDEWQLFAAS